ncbi:MAG TPA: lipase family protein [Verrucomicrobiae bacterium]|nr:lipase family protein [Verrucomicrobiae bacterium]
MLSDPQSAQYALLAMYAEDMYEALPANGKGNLSPPVDPRVLADWNVVGFIIGDDALLDLQNAGLGQPLFYGFLANSKSNGNQFVAVIRGTDNPIEWMEDVEFLPVDAGGPVPGKVENGFYSIYLSMKYVPVGGTAQPLIAGIAGVVGTNPITVVGHSLGSALATYLTLDLAVKWQPPLNVSACLIASPHAGDSQYANFFDSKVASYKVYNYSLDIVPRVPLLFEYTALPKATEITPQIAQASIRHTLGCNHHAACYAAMLDYSAADWTTIPGITGPTGCLVGKSPGA